MGDIGKRSKKRRMKGRRKRKKRRRGGHQRRGKRVSLPGVSFLLKGKKLGSGAGKWSGFSVTSDSIWPGSQRVILMPNTHTQSSN